MTVTESDLTSIKTDLLSGIDTRNRRSRNRLRAAAALPLIALVATATMIFSDGSGTPAYALMQQPDGSLQVQVAPEFDEVDALQADLEAAGLSVSIAQLRAHPSVVGRVEVVSHSNESSGAMEFQGGEFTIEAAAIERDIEILIYSSTSPGDDYQASPSIFSPGEPLAGLHCAYPDAPLPVAKLEAEALAVGVTNFRFTSFGDIDPNTGAIEHTDFDESPGGVVTGARMGNLNTLEVFVDMKSQEPAATTIVMHDGTHEEDYPTCTPELAARWN